MRNHLLVAVLLLGFVGCSEKGKKTDKEMADLKQRVGQLEAKLERVSEVIEPLMAEQRAKILRARFEKKMAQDQAKYTQEQLREAERLYQVANQKWGTPEADASLEAMIKKYPDINRTGCAVLYVAQKSQGDERIKYLKQCIEKHNDCYYGDGVQVGALARLILAAEYKSKGDEKNAAALYKELRSDYPDAVDHGGKLLRESMAD